MKQILSLIRRHPRLFAGSALILVVGIGLFGLRSAEAGAGAGSADAHAPAATTVARVHLPGNRTAGTVAQVRSSRRPVALATTLHATVTRRHVAHGGAAAGAGAPAPAPSNRAVSLALLRATGLSPSQVTVRQLCPAAGAGHARCAAEALVLRSTGALVHPRVTRASSGGPSSGNGPAALQQAYDLSYLSQTNGGSDTVGIVDAYNDPTAASDLSAYRSNYGLSACTSASGCFREVNENGGSTLPTTTSQDWDQEMSLDLDAVSAICPNCHILLVEASSANSGDMDTAMETAAAQGVNQISDSWTMISNSPPPGTYTFSGIATVAATGDSGYVAPLGNGTPQDSYPAALPGVTATGGTTLAPAYGSPTARGFSEGAWSGAGSGCDVTEGAKPAWQSDTGCTGRSYADLSADANPDTGLAVYDNGQWVEIGGTSLATPMVAAYYAITGLNNTGPQWAYSDSGALNDIVSGSNGSNCASSISYICNAGVGYDGPTGMGSISGATFTGAPGIAGPTIPTGQSSPTYTQSVASNNAMIAGGIYRNGLDTKWWIQYGTTTGYGSQTTAVDIGAGSAPVEVTRELPQLTAHTLYHYRLVAQNSLGTAYGADYSFTTATASNPSASFAVTSGRPAPNSPATFDASSSTAGTGATITDYSWSFGDGTSQDAGTSATFQHTYTQRGTYTVTLTVTNSANQAATISHTVIVDTPPTADFTPSAQISAPTAESFDASASTASAGGSIADYSWNFGDGTTQDTGTSATVQHAYANPGVYTVTLTTTDDLNVSDTVSETVIAGAFSASPTVPAPGTPVTFTVPTLTGVTGTITDYSWNFGDGTTLDTGTTPSASHTYSARQDEAVTLTITTSTGQTTSTVSGTETIPVDDAPNAALDAPSTLVGEPGQPVSFNGSDSDAESPGSIKTYTWNFGDGSAPVAASTPTASHAYAATGTYEATLTVTDDLGATDSTTQEVIVDQPAAAFTAPDVTSVGPSAPATFNAAGSSDALGTPIADYDWDFGDGTTEDTGTTPTATHAYSQRGTYTVTLTVTNSYGQTATTTRTATADNSPTAAFTPSATLTTPGGAINFNGGASAAMTGGSISDYYWNFGDGTALDTGGAASTTHTYGSPGTYTVTLTTTDDLGLTASASEQVAIQAAPAAATPPAPSTPAPTPAPVHAPVTPAPLSTSLGGATKLKLASALAHGMHVSLAVSQGAKVSFQITLPVLESKLAGHKTKTASIVLLHTGAQTLGAGTHPITLKLSPAAARELAASGPLVLTVKVTITSAGGKTVTRTLKISLSR